MSRATIESLTMRLFQIKAAFMQQAIKFTGRPSLHDCFDAEFYKESYPDVSAAGIDPLEHFTKYGYSEGRNPHCLIHTNFMKAFYKMPKDDPAVFINHSQQPSYFNALMVKPFQFDDLRRVLAAPSSNASRFFVFDYERWLSAQDDVVAHFPEHPILHLFRYGLKENRLTSSGAIDRTLVCGTKLATDLNGATDYQIISECGAPIEAATFRRLRFSTPTGMTHARKVTIGVVLYNNSQDEMIKLGRSIAMNRAEFGGDIAVLVADNSEVSLDTSNLASALNGVPYHFSQTPNNPGFALSHNTLMDLGFDQASDYYLGLNPDGFLLDNAVQNAISFSLKYDDDALIELRSEPICHPKWYHPLTGETTWVSGAAFLLPRQIYDATKGFDPKFPMYCEDVDLSFMVKQHGFQLRVASHAAFYHDITPRFGEKNELRTIRQLVGEWYLCKKWGVDERARRVELALAKLRFPLDQLPRPPRPATPTAELAATLAQARFGRSRFF